MLVFAVSVNTTLIKSSPEPPLSVDISKVSFEGETRYMSGHLDMNAPKSQ